MKIEIRKHAPERRNRPVVIGSVCCTTCCCCCCCLHSAGGLIGASVGVGWAMRSSGKSAIVTPEAEKSASAGIVAYWMILVALVGIVLLISLPFGSWNWLWVLLIGLPVLQLLASTLAFLVVVVFPVPDRKIAIAAVAKITAGAIIGAVAGGVLVVLALAALGIFSK